MIKLKEEKINKLFKATIFFENDRYMSIVLYLVYNGKEKLKNEISQIKFKVWEKGKFLTIDIENIKILEKLKRINKDDKSYIKDVLNYVTTHKQLLLDFVSLKANLKDFGINNLENLPAVKWKLKNLEKLQESNPVKFKEQYDKLASYFEE